MYFNTGDIKTRYLNVQGFLFKLELVVFDDHVQVAVYDKEHKRIDSIDIYDETVGIETAIEIINQSIYNWIESNTNEIDHIVTKLMEWS